MSLFLLYDDYASGIGKKTPTPLVHLSAASPSSIISAYQNVVSTVTGTSGLSALVCSGNESLTVFAGMTVKIAGTDVYTVASVATAAGVTTITISGTLSTNYTAAVCAVPRISQWSDISGNGNHVVQATTAFQPLYNVKGINNIGCFQGNGGSTTTGTYLHNDTVDYRVVGSGGWVLVCVLQKNIAGRCDAYTYKNGPGGADAWALVYDGSEHFDYFPTNPGGGTAASFTGVAVNTISTPYVQIFSKDNAGNFYSYINGTIDVTTTDTANYGLVASGTQLWIGSNHNSSFAPTFNLNGLIVDYQFYAHNLTPPQIQTITTNLRTTYNI